MPLSMEFEVLVQVYNTQKYHWMTECSIAPYTLKDNQYCESSGWNLKKVSDSFKLWGRDHIFIGL